MKTLSYTWIDKTDWPEGEWKTEPDKIQWQDETTNYPCLINRNHMYGNLCGYVGVDKYHPLFKNDYKYAEDIEVHGSLSFSSSCNHNTETCKSICHIPDENETDDIWWFGFDCGHFHDLIPGMSKYFNDNFLFVLGTGISSYRNITYVKAECARLAQQLFALATDQILTGK